MSRIIFYILVMAIVTYLIRCIPLLCFRKKITNRYIRSFLYYVPYAVLGSMTFPAIFTSGKEVIPSCIGCGVAMILAYQKRSLLVVALMASVAVCISTIILR